MPVKAKVPLQYWGTGRRKEAVARVRLIPGQGRVVINERPLQAYFPLPLHQALLQQPLLVTGTAEG